MNFWEFVRFFCDSFISHCFKIFNFVRIFFNYIKADKIYERIKSPVGLRKSPVNINILRGDEFKGYERILREITSEMNLPFNEYWSFLDHFCNLKTPEGLEKLEIYLQQKELNNHIDSQLKLANNILHNYGKPEENKEIIRKLNDFIALVDDLRDNKLFLRENQLSHSYEQFFKLGLNLSNKDHPIKSIIDQPNNSDQETYGLTHGDLEIYNSLVKYMASIIELSKLDKSSKCYFNLYKPAKEILYLLNIEKPFDYFYLSPVFKKISKNISSLSTFYSNQKKIKYELYNFLNKKNLNNLL